MSHESSAIRHPSSVIRQQLTSQRKNKKTTHQSSIVSHINSPAKRRNAERNPFTHSRTHSLTAEPIHSQQNPSTHSRPHSESTPHPIHTHRVEFSPHERLIHTCEMSLREKLMEASVRPTDVRSSLKSPLKFSVTSLP